MSTAAVSSNYRRLPRFSLTNIVKAHIHIDRYSKNNPLVVTIFGYFGMKNIGDDALLLTEIKHLRALKVPVEIHVPSRFPEVLLKQYDIISFRFGNLPKLISALLKSKIVVVGGGGLFCNPWKNVPFKTLLLDSLFTCYKTFFFLILPKLLGKTVLVVGVGYYSNQRAMAIKLTSTALLFVDYISVRDRHSYEFLRKLLPRKNINFYQDIVFSLTPESTLRYDKKFGVHNHTSIMNVAVSLVNIEDIKAMDKILTLVTDIINSSDSNTMFYYFPFYNNQNDKNDALLFTMIQSRLNEKSKIKLIPYDAGAEGFLQIYGKMQAAISMRFHAIVFGSIQKVKTYGISYDKKCESLLRDLNMPYATIADFNNENKSKQIVRDIKVKLLRASL